MTAMALEDSRVAAPSFTRGFYDFFFRPTLPQRLGFSRMLLYALFLVQYAKTDFSSYGDLPASFYNVLPLFRAFAIPILSTKYLAIIEAAFKLSLVGACVGRFTRMSMLTAAVSGSYLLAVPNNFGRAGHGDGVIILLLWVMAFSHAGDAWSLDRYFARKAGLLLGNKNSGEIGMAASGEYTWPIKMVWLLMSMVYVAAGVAKLHASGLAWVTSDNMAMTFLAHQVNDSNPLLNWGQHLARLKWFSHTLAGMTLVLELGFPLALFHPWPRRLFVTAMFAAHVGIALLMGVLFTQFMITYVFWIPWDSLGWVRGEATRRAGRSV